MSSFKQPEHPLTLIPGPVEFDDTVLAAMGHYSVPPTAQPFIGVFESVLKSLRTLFFNKDPKAQPFVISGSGTIGWDVSAANFLEAGDEILLLNTGFFASRWVEAFQAYGIKVTELQAEIGSSVPLAEVEQALKSGKQFKAVAATHVDTSTGVVNDLKAISDLVHKLAPDALILVDGVCSVAVEPLKFDEWKLDYVMTASQKAIGVPTGLHISMVSERALAKLESRKTPVPAYFVNFQRWLPVMRAYERGSFAYFGTLPVQLIFALKASLDKIATSSEAVEKRWADHEIASNKVKSVLKELGVKVISKPEVSARGLTTAYLPESWELPDLLSPLRSDGFIITGGILPPIAPRYFRIGHMNVSVYNGDIDKLIDSLKKTLAKQ